MEDEKERGSMINKMVEILEEILMVEEEQKEAMKSRMVEVLALAPVDVVVSWTGRRCSETGGSRMVKLTEAWGREGRWMIFVSGLIVK